MQATAQVSRVLLISLVIVAVLVTTTVGGWAIKAHGRLLSVQTGSMTPTLNRGDAVVERAVATTSLKVGDIVSYHSAVDPKMIITHRVIAIDQHHGAFITKGDSNPKSDQPVMASQIIGRAFAKAPAFGKLLDFEHTLAGLILTIYVPSIIVMIEEIYRLRRHYGRPQYRLHGSASV
jgi:signal peptidase I